MAQVQAQVETKPAVAAKDVGFAPGPKSNTTEVKLYRCWCRHGGEMLHEIPVYGASARELQLLRAIHGDDALVRIEDDGTAIVDERDEMFKLVRKYPHPLGASASRLRIEKLLNVSLHGYEEWLTQQTDAEEEARNRRMDETNRRYNENRNREQAAALTDAIRAAKV